MEKKTVIVYSTPTCPHCNVAKTYLTEKGVKYVDYDVSSDREKAKEMVQKTGQTGVPVIEIDDIVIVGFDRPKIDEALSGTGPGSVPKSNLFFDPMDQ